MTDRGNGAPPPEVRVVRDEALDRYELLVDGRHAGLLAYDRDPDDPARTVFVHTEIDAAFAGRGYGSVLVAGALDDARRRGEKVVPLCPFVLSYLRRHPQEADVVASAS